MNKIAELERSIDYYNSQLIRKDLSSKTEANLILDMLDYYYQELEKEYGKQAHERY